MHNSKMISNHEIIRLAVSAKKKLVQRRLERDIKVMKIFVINLNSHQQIEDTP